LGIHDAGGRPIEILVGMLHRRSMFEKRDTFFQLISTLLCKVKRGFVDPTIMVPCPWWRSANFIQGVLSQIIFVHVLVLVLRFLWADRRDNRRQWKK
jgi:hypothetical protein